MADGDQLLMRYAREGDVQSLSELVVAESRWLKAFLLGMTRSESDADDVFQETWMRVIRSCGAYRGGSVRAYLAKTARSVVIDAYRKADPDSLSLDADDGVGLPLELVDDAPLPDSVFERLSSSADVRRALEVLSFRQREVVLLRIEGELTFQEIADQLHIPLGTALTLMRTATIRLRKMLGGEK